MLTPTALEGLNRVRDVVRAFFCLNSYPSCASIGQLRYRSRAFVRAFTDWPESCRSIVIAAATTTLLRHNLKSCLRHWSDFNIIFQKMRNADGYETDQPVAHTKRRFRVIRHRVSSAC